MFAVRLSSEDNPLVIADQCHVRAIFVCDGQFVGFDVLSTELAAYIEAQRRDDRQWM